MAESVRVTVDVGGADKLLSALSAVESGTGLPQPIRDMYTQWGRRIEAFTKRRFEINSRGGGDWPPLAVSTVKQRRAASPSSPFAARRRAAVASTTARDTRRGGRVVSSGRSVAILRDTGVLFKALSVGAPGNTLTPIRGGLEYGISGSGSHSGGALSAIAGSARGRSSITIADLAAIHNAGTSRIPQRRIVVEPDHGTLNGMSEDAARAVARLLG